jgi:hypothetical protein
MRVHRYIPLDLRTFDLRKFRKVLMLDSQLSLNTRSAVLMCQVPMWVVEYKALQLIRNVVFFYVGFFMTFGVVSIYLCVLRYGEDRTEYREGKVR